jgi:hypothetical protein
MTFAAALSHGSLLPVVDGVFLVRGTFRMGPGMSIGRTMTVVVGDDGLVIFNAVRLSEDGVAELEKLGPVKHLVKLSESHGLDEPYFVDRFKPTVWAMPDAKHERGVTTSRVLGPDSPIAGGVVIDYPGTSGWRERGYVVHHGGGTLIATDAIQNHADGEGGSFLGGVVTRMMGFKGGVIVAPMWRRMQKVSGAKVTAAFAPLVAQSFENLVTGHGPALIGGADERVRSAVAKAS